MFSIYLHIPYCTAICAYCDFNVHRARRMPEERYVAALARELRVAAEQGAWRGRTVETVYFGGGTPSLFRPESIARLLEAIRDLWPVVSAPEVTLEANPGDAVDDVLKGFRDGGVNRLSLGIQSLDERHLKRLTRHHSPREGRAAIVAARGAGFDNVNADLIFAIPGQSLDEWEDDLRRVCEMAPEHVSAYGLTYEEGTPFHRWRASARLVPAPEEVEEVMFRRAREILGSAGYAHYEISNYARPGRQSRHNLNCWRGVDYLGVGAGAHSFLAADWGQRHSNERNPERYMSAVEGEGQARVFTEVLRRDQAIAEFVFLSLRQRRGIDGSEFTRRFALDLAAQFPHVLDLSERGVLEPTASGYRLTDRGLLIADTVFATFV